MPKDRQGRLLLAVLGLTLILLLVVCVVGTALVYVVYRDGQPAILATPGATSTVVALPPKGRAPATLILRPLSLPDTLDPHLCQDAASAGYIVHIFSNLVGIGEKLDIVPDLAETWEMSPDGETYTFTLRTDARFHDGKPVTAQDVKYSFERALDPLTKSPTADTYLGDIVGARDRLARRASEAAGITVLDERRIRITIDAPRPSFLWQMTYTAAAIVDRANVEAGGSAWADKPNGSGPFKLASKSASEIVLARNDSYYGAKPKLREVRFLLTGPGMSRYETGDIDVVQVTAADIARATDARNPLSQELVTVDQLDVTYLGLNPSMPPFDDPNVRQAIALAIDKEKLASVVLKSMSVKADSILPPGLPGYNKDLSPLSYDAVRAKQLLSQSKYASQMPGIVLTDGSASGQPSSLAAAVQEMLRQTLGLNIAIQLVDYSAFYDGLYERTYAMFITGWIADYPDPQDFLDVLFYSKSEMNHSGYSSSQVDALLDSARAERDETRRIQLYRQAEQLIINDAPVVPLCNSRDYWLIKPYVNGVKLAPLVTPWLQNVSLAGQ